MNKTQKLQDWYTNLSEVSLLEIESLYDSNCFFKDPFNELKGISKITKIFTHMFKELEDPRFIFVDVISNEDQSFFTWDFVFKKNGSNFKIHGSSHIKWESDKVIFHRDYWDVGEEILLKIPVVKRIYSILVNKLSVS